MDGRDFDRLARFVAVTSRRAAARVLVGAVVAGSTALLAGATGGEAGCFKPRKRCRHDEQCCSGRCRNGWCAGGGGSCPGGKERCGAACVDTRADPKHCGGCDRRCAAGQACRNGVCTCDADRCAGCCDGRTCLAVANQTDRRCGTGGASCEPCGCGSDCCGGVCCAADAVCYRGECCTPDCAGEACGAGGRDAKCGVASCGTCPAGEVCVDGACADVCPGSCPQECNCLVSPRGDPNCVLSTGSACTAACGDDGDCCAGETCAAAAGVCGGRFTCYALGVAC